MHLGGIEQPAGQDVHERQGIDRNGANILNVGIRTRTVSLVAFDLREDEAALLDASRNGDARAFSKLYRLYRAPLLEMCTRRVHDRSLAEDVVQDTFVRAFARLRTLDLSRPLWPWLVTVAERRCIDIHRRSARLALVERFDPTDDEMSVDEHATDRDFTFDTVYSAEERERLGLALARLSHRQRRALLLYALEGWTYADIASAEGISLLATKSLIFRARTHLRELCQVGVPGLLVWRPTHWLRRRRHGSVQTKLSLRMSEGLASAFAQNVASSFLPLVVSLATVGGGLAPTVVDPVVTTPIALASRDSVTRTHRTDGQPSDRETFGTADADTWVRDVTQPNSEIDEPEDTQVTSITFSPNFAEDRTIFIVGTAPCRVSCPPVLFRSRNGGATWRRMRADGFQGASTLLPPSFGRKDRRVFAMGPAGLQVSTNGGRSFGLAVPSGGLLLGSAAISPAFNDDDPRILIGAQALVQYDDRVRAFSVAPYSSLPGPLEPAFSPNFANDGLLVVGGTRVHPLYGKTAVIYRCTLAVCAEQTLRGGLPSIRVAPDFARSGSTFAFDSTHLFRSNDGAVTFEPLKAPGSRLRDLTLLGDGQLLAATDNDPELRASGGVFISTDNGATWTASSDRLLEDGARVMASTQELIIVGTSRGIACSSDIGRTWQSRCTP